MSAFDTLSTVEVHKKTGASTTSTVTLALTRKNDGSITFTDKDGQKVIVHSSTDDAMKRLFEALGVLV